MISEQRCRKAAWEKARAAMPSDSSDSGGPPPPGRAAPVQPAPAHATGLFSVGDDDDEPTGLGPAYELQRKNVAEDFAQKTAAAQRARLEHARAQAEDEDALDAFMKEDVLPEVAQRDAEVRFWLVRAL